MSTDILNNNNSSTTVDNSTSGKKKKKEGKKKEVFQPGKFKVMFSAKPFIDEPDKTYDYDIKESIQEVVENVSLKYLENENMLNLSDNQGKALESNFYLAFNLLEAKKAAKICSSESISTGSLGTVLNKADIQAPQLICDVVDQIGVVETEQGRYLLDKPENKMLQKAIVSSTFNADYYTIMNTSLPEGYSFIVDMSRGFTLTEGNPSTFNYAPRLDRDNSELEAIKQELATLSTINSTRNTVTCSVQLLSHTTLNAKNVQELKDQVMTELQANNNAILTYLGVNIQAFQNIFTKAVTSNFADTNNSMRTRFRSLLGDNNFAFNAASGPYAVSRILPGLQKAMKRLQKVGEYVQSKFTWNSGAVDEYGTLSVLSTRTEDGIATITPMSDFELGAALYMRGYNAKFFHKEVVRLKYRITEDQGTVRKKVYKAYLSGKN